MSEAQKIRQDFREYILRKLGACAVSVELSPEQVDDSINDALDLFNQYMCKAEPRVAESRSGSVEIPLQENDRGVINVKILFPNSYREYAQMNIFEVMYRMVFPRLPLGEWYTLKTYYKMYQQVRGTEPDWYEDESTKTLWVDCWSGPYDIFYVVSTDLDVEDIPTLQKAYTRMFKKLAVAEAKMVLARIRGKFGNSIPVPGGNLMLDGADLKSEAATEKAEVEEKLEKLARYEQSPVMWG